MSENTQNEQPKGNATAQQAEPNMSVEDIIVISELAAVGMNALNELSGALAKSDKPEDKKSYERVKELVGEKGQHALAHFVSICRFLQEQKKPAEAKQENTKQ